MVFSVILMETFILLLTARIFLFLFSCSDLEIARSKKMTPVNPYPVFPGL